MSFSALSVRLNSLPLVLAGPMVRRVEPESVSVWIVLREPRNVRLVVDDPNGVWQSDLTPTWDIGEFLHMVVVTGRPPQPIPDGTSLNYNVLFEPQTGGPTVDLFTPDVVATTSDKARDLLAYPSDPKRTPSFMVPPASLDKLRILHTSCRKIKGDGIDAFPALDHILDDHMRHPASKLRPAMLFLTGDQIYADGSDRDLLDIATDIGVTLLGRDEELPVVDSLTKDLPRSRTVVAVEHAGLKNPRQHPVLGLGEFIALYLLTFSDSLWPPDHHGDKDFRNGLLATRRLFANVATYMMFDDHEVSDSLYLSWAWIFPVFKSDLGRRVLQNAFSSYALCQGWGNTPDSFASPRNPLDKDPPGLVLLKSLVEWRKTGFTADTDPERRIQQAVGIPDVEAESISDLSAKMFHGPDTLAWHYTVPCKAIAINVLDVYTWSNYDKGEYDPADHLPMAALDAQVKKIDKQLCALYVASNVVIHRHPRTIQERTVGAHTDSITPAVWGYLGRGAGILGVTAVALYTAHVLFSSIVFWFIVVVLVGLAIGVVLAVRWVSSAGGIPSMSWLLRALRVIHFEEIGTEFEWHTAAFERLLDQLARASAHEIDGKQLARVLFISGDVHQSFAMRLSYFADFDQGSPKLSAIFAQVIGSPSKYLNESAESFDDRSSGEFAGWKKAIDHEEEEPRQMPGGEKVDWLGRGEYWVTKIKPDLPAFQEKEDYRYRIEPIKPRPEPLTISTLPPHSARTFDDFLSQLTMHQRVALLKARHADVVRANNVADLTFQLSGDTPTVRQDVWWWYSGLGSDPSAWFVRTYEVDMALTVPPKQPGVP